MFMQMLQLLVDNIETYIHDAHVLCIASCDVQPHPADGNS